MKYQQIERTAHQPGNETFKVTSQLPGLSRFKLKLINVGLALGELLLLIGGDDFSDFGKHSQHAQDLTHSISSFIGAQDLDQLS